MNKLPIYSLNTFIKTEGEGTNFTGNPAGVVVLTQKDEIDEILMQKIANEMKQPATAFISPISKVSTTNITSTWTARWFSPSTELTLCGHGSLAAVEIILNKLDPEARSVTLIANSGELIHATKDLSNGILSLNFPSCPPSPLPSSFLPWIDKLVDKILQPSNISDDVQYSEAGGKIIIRLRNQEDVDSESTIRNITPDIIGAMEAVPNTIKIIGVGITIQNIKSETNGDTPIFYSRFFAPWAGVNEDEVCGSLHAILTPYWSKLLGKGYEPMKCSFGSPRGGDIFVKQENNRVQIGGKSALITEGAFYLD